MCHCRQCFARYQNKYSHLPEHILLHSDVLGLLRHFLVPVLSYCVPRNIRYFQPKFRFNARMVDLPRCRFHIMHPRVCSEVLQPIFGRGFERCSLRFWYFGNIINGLKSRNDYPNGGWFQRNHRRSRSCQKKKFIEKLYTSSQWFLDGRHQILNFFEKWYRTKVALDLRQIHDSWGQICPPLVFHNSIFKHQSRKKC